VASKLVPSQYPTISSAMAAANSGDEIYVSEGVYTDQVILKSGVSLFGIGNVTVGATSLGNYGATIEIAGVHDVLIDNFNIQGKTSTWWSNVEGLSIRDLGAVGGTASYNVIVRNCRFTGIYPKPDVANSLGTPIVVTGLGDTRLGHTHAHDILIENCTFINNNPTSTAGITVGYISVIGNVENITIKDCYFYHSAATVGKIANAVNFSGNYSPSYPATPRYCRVVGCTFESPYDGIQQQSVYLNVVHDVIVERNFIDGWGLGPMVAAEAGNLDEFESYNIIIRRNIIKSSNSLAVSVAAWTSFYKKCYNIWVDSNTIHGDVFLVDINGQEPCTGVLITNNIITSRVNDDYYRGTYVETNNTSDTEIRIDNLYRDTPDWVVYNTQELDYNGTKQKRTRGAEEKQWIRRKPVRKY